MVFFFWKRFKISQTVQITQELAWGPASSPDLGCIVRCLPESKGDEAGEEVGTERWEDSFGVLVFSCFLTIGLFFKAACNANPVFQEVLISLYPFVTAAFRTSSCKHHVVHPTARSSTQLCAFLHRPMGQVICATIVGTLLMHKSSSTILHPWQQRRSNKTKEHQPTRPHKQQTQFPAIEWKMKSGAFPRDRPCSCGVIRP